MLHNGMHSSLRARCKLDAALLDAALLDAVLLDAVSLDAIIVFVAPIFCSSSKHLLETACRPWILTYS